MQKNSEQTTGCTDGDLSQVSRSAGFVGVLGVILFLTLLHIPDQAFSATPAPPGNSVTLAWDSNPNPEITGYRVYYGVASRNYTNSVVVGKVTSVTISGLVSGVPYFFASTTIGTAGLESDYSDEVSYTVPIIPVVNLLRTLLNGQAVLGVTGPVGHTYQVQASRLLVGWVPIGIVTVAVPGVIEFTDVNAVLLPALAYRLVEVFPPGLKMVRLPNKQVVLTVTGRVGHPYEIQATQTLTSWTVLGTVTPGASGSSSFTDTGAGSYSRRFYRVRDTQP